MQLLELSCPVRLTTSWVPVEKVRSSGGELLKFMVDIVCDGVWPTKALYKIILASTRLKGESDLDY